MHCHLRVSVAGSPPRTVVLRLSPDLCPAACRNFAALCSSTGPAAVRPGKRDRPGGGERSVATYRGTEFHRIVPGFMIQGGDFANFDGSGGHAAPTTNGGEDTFPDDGCFAIPHDSEGVLSMANRGPNTNGSQFFVTLGRALHLDGKHVAFGRVESGMDVLREAARVETDGSENNGGGRPVSMQRVVVVDCGVGTGAGSDDDDDSTASRRRKKHRSKDKHSKKKKRRRRRREEDDDDDESHERNERRKQRKRRRRRDDDDDNNNRAHRSRRCLSDKQRQGDDGDNDKGRGENSREDRRG